jgi:hypothetical protein
MASSSNGRTGLTAREIADLLDPPVTTRQVMCIVQLLGLKPCGYRRSGQRGRPAALYEPAAVMKVHAALVPYLPG